MNLILNWRRFVCLASLPLALFAVATWAQVGDTDKDTLDCDLYASLDDIPSRGIRKSAYGFIDVNRALAPCSASYARNPKNSRVQAQLARVYFQQGKFEQGIGLAKASAKEQAISLALLGEASRRGVGGHSMSPRDAARYFQEGADRELRFVTALEPLLINLSRVDRARSTIWCCPRCELRCCFVIDNSISAVLVFNDNRFQS